MGAASLPVQRRNLFATRIKKFIAFAKALGAAPERILYVGNSLESDVKGASAVGMKTACIVNPLSLALGRVSPRADISFSSYRKLTAIVLK